MAFRGSKTAQNVTQLKKLVSCLAAMKGVKDRYKRKCPCGFCSCPRIFQPVCGRDGELYYNSCVAKCNGVINGYALCRAGIIIRRKRRRRRYCHCFRFRGWGKYPTGLSEKLTKQFHTKHRSQVFSWATCILYT